jgi:hypothetical protein
MLASLVLHRLVVSRDAAFSRNHNPRNLEHLWYPFWEVVADRLVARVGLETFFVAPQYPLWRLPDQDKVKPSDESEDEEDDEENPTPHAGPIEDVDSSTGAVGDVDMDGSSIKSQAADRTTKRGISRSIRLLRASWRSMGPVFPTSRYYSGRATLTLYNMVA